MDILDKQIQEFLQDRSSGSMELATHELTIVNRLYSSGSPESRIKDFLQKAVERFPQMIVIQNLQKHFVENPISEESIKSFENLLSDHSCSKNAEFLFDKKRSIITFSRSSSVEKVLVHYKDRIEQVICCHSLPLGEGKYLYNSLHDKGLKTFHIEDAELSHYMKECDYLLLGADAITENYFVNKVGSLQAVLIARYFGKPVYVISSKLKKSSVEDYDSIDPGRYFEKIERTLIKDIIF
ncbi:MAG TPA: hypothetical protein ENG70_00490 [Candidatus Cloacimonetes bacterium]|nr:hypothetical protein [Candidatus Cloacimonadota bacterium]HEX37333.1 hypothetical protein [Candidatus Cloacimonadota bacterium]